MLNKSIVQVYESFTIKDIKLSDNPEYCSEIKSTNVIVQVQEYLDGITLDEKVFQMSNENINNKVIFLIQLKNKLEELLNYIKTKGLYHYDISALNFMLRNSNDLNTLTFIDAESFDYRKKFIGTSEEFDKKIKRKLEQQLLGNILTPLSEMENKIIDY
ncbi:MAG: hypothetical protein H7263_16535, partial [Candidatus Sericytochromatia bacterium]|nr:hypothetical protein [Candidatus Sericytochromatia bacterium]